MSPTDGNGPAGVIVCEGGLFFADLIPKARRVRETYKRHVARRHVAAFRARAPRRPGSVKPPVRSRSHRSRRSVRRVASRSSPVSLDEPAVSGVGSTGVVSSEGADQLASPCSHCDGHGLMQTGYTGTLQYCGECNACDGSGTVPVVTDEERAALRSACSKCGGLVRLELRCEACGDLPAVEGAERHRDCVESGLPALESLCRDDSDRAELARLLEQARAYYPREEPS